MTEVKLEAFSTFNASVSDEGTITLQWRNKDSGVMLLFGPDGRAQISRKSGRGDFYSSNVEEFDPREGLPELRLNTAAPVLTEQAARPASPVVERQRLAEAIDPRGKSPSTESKGATCYRLFEVDEHLLIAAADALRATPAPQAPAGEWMGEAAAAAARIVGPSFIPASLAERLLAKAADIRATISHAATDESGWSGTAPIGRWEAEAADLEQAAALIAKHATQPSEAVIVERCAKVARDGCLVPPDGGEPTDAERRMCEHIATQIEALAVATILEK